MNRLHYIAPATIAAFLFITLVAQAANATEPLLIHGLACIGWTILAFDRHREHKENR